MPSTTENTMTTPFDQKTSETVRDRVSQAGAHVKNTAADFGRSAADSIDRNIDSAAGALETAASSLRSRVGEGGSRMTEFARTTADKLEGTAKYFRDHHSRDMAEDLGRVVRRNPGMSMLAALGIGFLIGQSMRRDRY